EQRTPAEGGLSRCRVKIPRGREECEGCNVLRALLRQRQGKQAAHAVAQQQRSLPCFCQNLVQCRLQASRDVASEVDAPLRLTRLAPVEQEGPETSRSLGGGQPAREAALWHEVEDIAAIDKRGDEEKGITAVVRAPKV